MSYDDAKFCTFCGRELISKKGTIYSYEGKTGDIVLRVYKYCPKRQWWNFFHDWHNGLLYTDGHTAWCEVA